MSFFYLKPVYGDMPVYLLEIIITKRLEYLNCLRRGEETVYNEYLVEGGIYDNVGHFMLCIMSILGNSYGFTRNLLDAEVQLFKQRLKSLSTYDLRCFSKKLLKAIRKLQCTASYIEPLQVLCQHLMLRDIPHHLGRSHNDNCCVYNINVKFKHCPQLIAKRQVEIKEGIAYIPCSKWKLYLVFLFRNQLKQRLRNTKLNSLNNDTRIMDLISKFKDHFNCFTDCCDINVLSSKDVDSASKFFPPCMLNLHQNLRQRHRLSHTQRFYFSLFLKDIGMPLNEAIDFWREEYRKIKENHNCSHNWDKDEKKFVYGIRHLYGLEGGRKIYTSVNCKKIQSIDCASSEGGCPFKNFDDNKMLDILSVNSNELLMSEINELKKGNHYISACELYLIRKFAKSIDTNLNHIFNFTPLKFYLTASKSKH